MRIRSVSSLSLSMIVAGCSIHPLPRDVTRDTTLAIVEKIRCEARDALVRGMINVLEEEHSTTNLELLQKLRQPGGASAEKLCRLSPLAFDEAARGRLNKFRTAATTYTFDFTIKENKMKAGGATFKVPFTQGTFTLGLTAGSDKTRSNLRNIEFSETFSSLLFGRYADGSSNNLFCDMKPQRKHWIYPITGRIGLAELIDTYVKLVKTTKDKLAFSDKLSFTTKFDMSAKPSVELTRIIPKKFNLVAANVDYIASREDVHEVKISLNIPEAKEDEPEKPEKEIALFYPLFTGDGENGLPKKSKFGLAFEKDKETTANNKQNKKTKYNNNGNKQSCNILEDPDKIVEKFFGAPAVHKVKMVNPFHMTVQEERESLRQSLEESRRVDDLDTTRRLRDLIGK